jgi:23S rRNA pseudouridine1911/1915/1917 synthase
VAGRVVRSVKEAVAEGAEMDVLDVAEASRGRGGKTGVVLEEGLKVAYFDGDMVIVEKPSGLLTATDAKEKRPTAWRILREYFRRQNHRSRTYLIHRLDREASGLLVFARTWEAYGALKRQFFEHTIERVYEVVVEGVPAEKKGMLEDYLLEDGAGVVQVTKDVKAGKLAILEYEVVEAGRGQARLRCRLHTGRKHQIRVQLAARGWAVCGDEVYGKKQDAGSKKQEGRLALHAMRLGLVHPRTGKGMVFESPVPGGVGRWMRG